MDDNEIHIASIAERLTGLKCPKCGKPADGGTNLDDERAVRMPKPGDFAVCVYCGALHCYTETLTLRAIERTERRRMRRDPRLGKLLEIAADVAARYRRGIQ